MSDRPALRLGHISDLHVLELTGVPLRAWASKRITGLANLALGRRGSHSLAIAEALPTALSDAGVDHVALTGDVSNLSLTSEFQRARDLIANIGGPERLTLIPGNHDVYTRGALASARFERCFARWLAAPGASAERVIAAGEAGRLGWPIVRDLTPFARIYALSSAIPTGPLIAQGEVGAEQLARLAAARQSEPATVRHRIVMLHHNLHRRSPLHERTAQLTDRAQLARALRELGATLVLHGHSHEPNQHHLVPEDGSGTRIPVLGCGSSTWNRPDRDHMAHFNTMDLEADGGISAKAYVWRPESRRFEAERQDLLDRALASPLPW